MNLYDEINLLIDKLQAAWGTLVIVCDGKTCAVVGGVRILYQAPTLLEALRLAEAGAEQVTPSVRTCRVCGCTDDKACEGGCWWVESDLCSACVATEGAKP